MHWLIAPSYLFNALNISEFGEPPGVRHVNTYHSFSTKQIHWTFTPRFTHS
jgi:hypothetical protein